MRHGSSLADTFSSPRLRGGCRERRDMEGRDIYTSYGTSVPCFAVRGTSSVRWDVGFEVLQKPAFFLFFSLISQGNTSHL